MKIKSGASIQGLDIRMRPALVEADVIWSQRGKELVVTSGLDGEHIPASLHYYGLAVDLRTRYFTKEEKEEVRQELQTALGMSFDVISEKSNMHVEYNNGY